MNNFEHLKTMSKNKMADFLYAMLRTSCYYPRKYDCKKCIAKSLCDIEGKRNLKCSIVKWLESEVENE